MFRKKILKICFNVSLALITLGLLGIIYFKSINNTTFQILSIALLSVAILALLATISLIVISDKNIKQHRNKYSTLTPCQMDYKDAIKSVKSSYNLCDEKYKNVIEKPSFAENRNFCDFSVLKKGNIYYGCTVIANTNLFSQPNKKGKVLPAVIVYSEDSYYQENPLDLQNIALDLCNNSQNNILANQSKYFFNEIVNSDQTEGRIVYVTTIMAYRNHLPFGHLIKPFAIVPIIASPKTSNSVFIVDCKFWTDSLVADYMNLNAQDEILPSKIDD